MLAFQWQVLHFDAGQREYSGFGEVLEASKLSCSGNKVHLCMVMISGCQLVIRKQTLLVKALMMLPWQQQTTSTGTSCETLLNTTATSTVSFVINQECT